MNKTIIYYTDNSFLYAPELQVCLHKSAGEIPIISVSHTPIDFGHNICVGRQERSPETIRKQILTALLYAPEGIIYFCEHDVIYPPSHFEFIPPKKKRYYYNMNRWYMRLEDGMASYYRGFRAVSRLVTHREDALRFYLQRKVPKHYEPGVNKGDYFIGNFKSEQPIVDIRHKGTVTGGDKFVPNKKRRGFRFSKEIPYWGKTYGRSVDFIEGLNG